MMGGRGAGDRLQRDSGPVRAARPRGRVLDIQRVTRSSKTEARRLGGTDTRGP